ncbi:uncharacterized protein LOC113281931 isoform X2 [Papaver somniferum]|uniref:uncharacterized protein LOC113281931 isoform X2 n=1 Tax=Papaver somniferum TaxID=3469 RepID=UPI000E6FEE60|nr:uncharacterized protein LOC113281931 isoform X2 [Papaver somniferum]
MYDNSEDKWTQYNSMKSSDGKDRNLPKALEMQAKVAVVCAIEWAITLSCRKIVINSDSQSVVADFKSGNIPWFIKARWLKASAIVLHMNANS